MLETDSDGNFFPDVSSDADVCRLRQRGSQDAAVGVVVTIVVVLWLEIRVCVSDVVFLQSGGPTYKLS